ncbi:MAG: D-alanyl-D-alanine carboxypeptidase family protein [Bacillota bacterium]
MNTFKKYVSISLILMLLCGIFVSPVYAEPIELELTVKSAALIEAETGALLYAKNADEPLPPASLTKIMTLLVSMEAKDQGLVGWETKIVTSQKAWETGEGGLTSTMFLNINQQATFKELIQGIAIISANDACVAVAEHLYGSEAAFVQKMNQRAAELGLKNTHFVNTHGLHDPEQNMSAIDIARLAAYFVKTQPEAAAFQSVSEFTFNEIRQFNRNPLLGNFPGVDGIKTGYTPEAGWLLASTSLQQGMRLVAVVMGANSNESRREDSEALLSYGFREYELSVLHEAGAVVTSAPVSRGKEDELPLIANRQVAAVVPRGESAAGFTERLVLTEPLVAPVEAGQSVGTLELVDEAGQVVSEVELFAAESMERVGFFQSIFRAIGNFFSGLWQRGRNLTGDNS